MEQRVYLGKWKKYDRKTWIGAMILALLPIVCGYLYCFLEGHALSELYLPSSTWNDEMFYYKMVESVLKFGYPQGYFGFNESHGMYLSFAAWSPVLLIGWVFWGALFGWTMLSPIYANLAMLAIAFLIYGLVVKPSRGQIISIICLYAAFRPATRFALSCIPEAELFAIFIIYLAVCQRANKAYKSSDIQVAFFMTFLMTLMRPYLILLFVAPAYLYFREKGRKSLIGTGIVVSITVVLYWAINHFFSAEYLTDLFYTDWVDAYFERGLFGGIRYTLAKLWGSLRTMFGLMKGNLVEKSGLITASGLYYTLFWICLIVLTVLVIIRMKKSEKGSRIKDSLLELQLLFMMVGFLGADLLMYRIQEGGRHTLILLLGCILVFVKNYFELEGFFLNPVRRWVKYGFVALQMVLMLLLFVGRGNIPYEFSCPYGTEDYKAELKSLGDFLGQGMKLVAEKPSYDNTIVWVFSDQMEDGSFETVDFGAYYFVPKGFGVNLCDYGYLVNHIDSLRCRYVGTIPGGSLQAMCEENGGRVIGWCETLIVYDMKPGSVEQTKILSVDGE